MGAMHGRSRWMCGAWKLTTGIFAASLLSTVVVADALGQTGSRTGNQAGAAGSGGYVLTADEMKLDCPKLTGQMKVRILTMRADMEAPRGTMASRAMQSTVVPIFGGTSRGADPAADIRRDRAKLEAFNRRLAEKKCKTLDIDAELRGGTAPQKDARPGAISR